VYDVGLGLKTTEGLRNSGYVFGIMIDICLLLPMCQVLKKLKFYKIKLIVS
jgi:hypothetical protein